MLFQPQSFGSLRGDKNSKIMTVVGPSSMQNLNNEYTC